MGEHERVDTLIKILEGDNAKAFSIKTGIPESSLCRIRRGAGKPSSYYDRILSAYPSIRKNWLYFGNGEPLKDSGEKGEVLRKLERLETEVKRLASLVESMIGYQKSTNEK